MIRNLFFWRGLPALGPGGSTPAMACWFTAATAPRWQTGRLPGSIALVSSSRSRWSRGSMPRLSPDGGRLAMAVAPRGAGVRYVSSEPRAVRTLLHDHGLIGFQLYLLDYRGAAGSFHAHLVLAYGQLETLERVVEFAGVTVELVVDVYR